MRLLSALCALFFLVLPASAHAHAVLVGAAPSWGTTASTAPRAIRLVFDEDVVPGLARVSVISARGQDLAGAAHVTGPVVVVPLGALTSGSYTVRWRMVASADGHATEGAYSFGVDAKAIAPAAARGVGLPVAPELLAWLQFAGVVLAGGMLAFRALVIAPAARSVGARTAPGASLATAVAAAGAVVALHAGVLGFLAGAYPIVGGSLGDLVNTQIEPIRAGTHLGQAWTLMTFAWLGVLALLVAAWVTPAKRERLLAYAGLCALGTAFGISWASHPASHGAPALAADYVHLLAGAMWVGALVALILSVSAARALSSPEREAIARECFLRFSRAAVLIVVLVAGAGVFLALSELRAPGLLVSSSYGITLALKSAFVLLALGLGGYHRRVVVPRLAAGAPLSAMRSTLVLELGFLALVLVLAAGLSQTAPPH